jgi:acyl dehydratase
MLPRTVSYDELKTGEEFPQITYTITPRMVAAYLRAVGESSGLFFSAEGIESGSLDVPALVPPTAVAALAMKGLMSLVTLPPGSVHLSQELRFLKPALINDSVICRVSVGKKQERGGLRLVAFDVTVLSQDGSSVIEGKTLVNVPAKAPV